jgi:protein-disulfide isomerase
MPHLKPAVSVTDHIQGNPDATVTLVEYGDYQCPHCGHAYPIIKKLQRHFGGKLRFVFRNFPLESIHPFAFPAAIATEAAAKQNKFWEMHDAIFENQNNLDIHLFQELAEALDIEISQFNKDCSNQEVILKVENDFESGVRSGVNGTPSFFINGSKYNGANEFDELYEVINNLL